MLFRSVPVILVCRFDLEIVVALGVRAYSCAVGEHVCGACEVSDGAFRVNGGACETVDSCAETLITEALNQDYTTLVIADHGNCDTMINEDGSPNTAHTTNPVPLILVDKELKEVKDGVLGDIAPTILKLMGIDQPASMTQKPLV